MTCVLYEIPCRPVIFFPPGKKMLQGLLDTACLSTVEPSLHLGFYILGPIGLL